jgi:hypothetical protein
VNRNLLGYRIDESEKEFEGAGDVTPEDRVFDKICLSFDGGLPVKKHRSQPDLSPAYAHIRQRVTERIAEKLLGGEGITTPRHEVIPHMRATLYNRATGVPVSIS